MPTVAMALYKTSVCAIQILSATHTKFAVHKRRTHAQIHNVELVPSVVHLADELIAFAQSATQEIRLSSAAI